MKINFDQVENEITIHKLFDIYKNDFGKSNVQIINYIIEYNKKIGNKEEIINQI